MRKLFPLLIVLVLLNGLLLAACSSGDAGDSGSAEAGPAATQVAPPADYAGRTNPYQGEDTAAMDGKVIYQTNCASCHGQSAMGNGPAATSLDPKPQNLADNVADMADGYLLWRISEGGAMAPFHSAMPAWKTILTEDQLWQVITYLRTLGE